MPASSAGVEEVVGRIRAIQRRLNAATVQHAAYLAATVGVLAATVVVATALRAGTTVFGVAFWTALAAACLATAYAALRIRQGWLSIEQTAHIADRRASLEGRLVTLLAAGRDGAVASRLYPMLIAQVRDTAPRWDADTLAPRRIPRSLYALCAALAALIATSFYARPPLPPPSQPSSLAQQGAPAPAETPRTQPGHDGETLAALLGGANSKSGETETGTLAAEASGDSSDGPGGKGESNGGAHTGPGAGTGEDEGSAPESDPAAQLAGLSDRMQDSIRDALGAGTGDRDRAAVGEDTTRPQGREDRSAPSDSNASAPPDARSKAPDSQLPPEGDDAPQDKSGGPTGAAGGAGAAGSEASLFAGEPGSKPAGGGSQSLSVKLGAHTALAPSQHEPQRQSPPLDSRAAAVASSNQAAQLLADEQLPIAALQKPEVAAEHEAIVRRIFTRDE